MTQYNITLHPPTVANAINFFENDPRGIIDSAYIGALAVSATDVINNIHPIGGGYSALELITGDSFTINMPKQRFSRVVRAVTAYLGGFQ